MFRTGNKHDPAPSPQPHEPQPTREPATTTTEQPRTTPAPQEDAMQDRGPRSTPADAQLNALLGRGSEFDGKLSFEGTVRIDGTFTGEISTNDTLHIGEGAKVSAEISCGTVIVEGDVVGNIKATGAVELHRPAKVRGDITSPSLSIEKGVVFEGRSKMESLEGSNVVNLRAAADEA